MHLFVDLLVLRLQVCNRVYLRLRQLSLGMSFKAIEQCLGFLQLRADFLFMGSLLSLQ